MITSIGMGLVSCAFFLVFGAIFSNSGFLPYVFDSNESFSSLIHAYNLYHFDLGESMGLADEAASPYPDAHPVVHSHQGNWPRLFAFAIFVLGARTIEAQIVVTTFTVGLASIFLAHRLFSRIASPGFALVACLVLLSDYVLFAQWQVVTYRVWHTTFFFGALLCAHEASTTGRRSWIALSFLVTACLFYYELVFAAFVAVMCGLYAGFTSLRTPKRLASVWAAQVSGACFGIAVVLGQLIGYLGWQGFVEDIRITLTVRNYGADGESIARLRQFLEHHNIAAFFNFVDARPLLNVGHLIDAFFVWGFQVHTPALAVATLPLAGAWALAPRLGGAHDLRNGRPGTGTIQIVLLLAAAFAASLAALTPAIGPALLGLLALAAAISAWIRPMRGEATPLRLLLAMIGLAASAFTFLHSAFAGPSPVDHGSSPGTSLSVSIGLALAAGALALTAAGLLLRVARDAHGGRDASLWLCSWLFVGTACLVNTTPSLFDVAFTPLWRDELLPLAQPSAWRLAIVAAVGVAAWWTAGGAVRSKGAGVRFPGLLRMLGCGFAAFVVAYALFPGYLHSGYLWRHAPFHVFLIDTVTALAAYVILMAGQFAARSAWAVASGPRRRKEFWVPVGGVVAIASLIVFLGASWTIVQANYMRLFPPDSFAFTHRLASPPLAGTSFVSNSYALPFAVLGGSWAYLDETMGNGVVTLSDTGYELLHDDRYLWFADRATNPAYRTPAYFVCFFPQTFQEALARHGSDRTPSRRTCSSLGIVRQAKGTSPSQGLDHRLIASDPSPADRWAIVALDWNFPPFLSAAPGAGPANRVAISLDRDGGNRTVEVAYEYRQQNGIPEASSTILLETFETEDSRCYTSRSPVLEIEAKGGVARLELPSGMEGPVAATVTPKSTSKTGRPETSRLLDVATGKSAVLPPCPQIGIVSLDTNVSPGTN